MTAFDAKSSRIKAAFSTYRATGDLSLISFILRSEVPLTIEDRESLADFFDGKIKLPRGKPSGSVGPRDEGSLLSEDAPLAAKLAAAEVDSKKAELSKAGRQYGMHDKVVDEVAEKHGIDPAKLGNLLRRPKKKRT